jgi:hypothetical protein
MNKSAFESNNILKVIDFVNHHYGGLAKVTEVYHCEDCSKTFPEGQFRYSIGGFIPGPGVLMLQSTRQSRFPLHQLHTLLAYTNSDEIYENMVILELFRLSKNWTPYDVPEHCFDAYTKVMMASSLISIASLDVAHWCDALHGTPNWTEEELQNDPDKRKIIDMEKEIFSRPDEIHKSVDSEINYLFKEITKNRGVPQKYLIPKSLQQETGEYFHKLSFIENTYNTFKAKNIFCPDSKRNSTIITIDSYLSEAETEHKKHPSPF